MRKGEGNTQRGELERGRLKQTAEAVWDSNTLAPLRSEYKVIKNVQCSGSKGDAVLYNTWLLGLDWREGLGQEEGGEAQWDFRGSDG